MKKFAALAMSAIVVTLLSGCAAMEDMRLSRHEGNSTDLLIRTQVPFDKLDSAIEKSAKKLGYNITKEHSDQTDGDFQGEGIEISYKKDGKIIRLFTRVGSMGDDLKEEAIIKEIKKELKIKQQ